jgi:hypothetical protein
MIAITVFGLFLAFRLEANGGIDGMAVDILTLLKFRPQGFENLARLFYTGRIAADKQFVATAADLDIQYILDFLKMSVLFPVKCGDEAIILENDAFLISRFSYDKPLISKYYYRRFQAFLQTRITETPVSAIYF